MTKAKNYTPDSDSAVAETATTKIAEALPDKYAEAAKRRAEDRKMRLNLSGLAEQKLLAPVKQGFKRRWVNDDANRLADIQRKGYSFVSQSEVTPESVYSTDMGDKISQVVGTSKNGNPLRAYLMEIPTEWYSEDEAEREQSLRKTEEQIRTANHGSQGLKGSVMYDPNPHANNLKL